MKKIDLSYTLSKVKGVLTRPRLKLQTKAVLIDDIVECESPIFILGCHRSGTSLMRRIIGSHSNIFCPPETFFLPHFLGLCFDLQSRAGLKGFGYSESELNRVVASWFARHHNVGMVAAGKKRWADKTPQYSLLADKIDELFEGRPNYVIVIRHPYDVAYSLARQNWVASEVGSSDLGEICQYVLKIQMRLLSFRSAHPERSFILKYEDVVADPERALKRMFDQLNESWESSVLEFNKAQHNFGVEDTKVGSLSKVVDNTGGWRRFADSDVRVLRKYLKEFSEELGYDEI